MTGKSHFVTAIGSAFAITGDPVVAAAAAVTASAPDYAERIIPFVKIRHRGPTHALVLWAPLLISLSVGAYLWDTPHIREVIWGLSLGYLAHLFFDSLSISGIPYTLSKNSKRLAFKIYKTGGFSEYIVLFFSILILAAATYYFHNIQ